jgi:HD-GYP domain-containing protein (c-di-GMP phosphodiesterase class II)
MVARVVAPTADRPDEFVEHVFLYSPLHDIGKIGIPDAILLKPGPLTDEEWVVMRSHTTKGREMVDRISADLLIDYLPDQSVLQNIVELHHEALDGSGYPYGLKGDAVPLEARIVSIADVFDALTSERPYKEPWTTERSVDELRRMVDRGRLDGDCVEALAANLDEATDISIRLADVAVA